MYNVSTTVLIWFRCPLQVTRVCQQSVAGGVKKLVNPGVVGS